MTTSPATAGPTLREKRRGQHEESRTRVEIARLTGTERVIMGGEHLAPARMIKSQPAVVRLRKRA
ncbi:hypothetical protein Ahu01nite_047630 [Winogradskya humida]|uniref:Uncharacterized protein n=1 Tax=Winogradskya humida TaxID=113566 RepID=A0ABQ3ZST3_9ACTN|nr:hypothetical protein Ahu01nite_047630 [Actinoplanes humidus]